jgi:hypothetical protein
MLYPWYETLNQSNEIRQGDFIPECPILVPPTGLDFKQEGSTQYIESVTLQTLNAVVMSQSCDLEHGKLEIVLVCPLMTLEQFIEGLPSNDRNSEGRKKKSLKTRASACLPFTG